MEQTKVRIWHEKEYTLNKQGHRVRRSVAVLWKGDARYVGISACSDKDNFDRKRGREIAVGRAQKLSETPAVDVHSKSQFPFKFSFNVGEIGDSLLPPYRDFLNTIPVHLYKDVPRTEQTH